MSETDAERVVRAAQERLEEVEARVERCSKFMAELEKHENFFDAEEVDAVKKKYGSLVEEHHQLRAAYEKKTKLYDSEILVYERAIEVRNAVLEDNSEVKAFLTEHGDVMRVFAQKHAAILKHLQEARVNLQDC